MRTDFSASFFSTFYCATDILLDGPDKLLIIVVTFQAAVSNIRWIQLLECMNLQLWPVIHVVIQI